MTSTLALRVLDNGAVRSLVPVIDGRSLIGLVAAYESARGYSPAGGYGGVIPDSIAIAPPGVVLAARVRELRGGRLLVA